MLTRMMRTNELVERLGWTKNPIKKSFVERIQNHGQVGWKRTSAWGSLKRQDKYFLTEDFEHEPKVSDNLPTLSDRSPPVFGLHLQSIAGATIVALDPVSEVISLLPWGMSEIEENLIVAKSENFVYGTMGLPALTMEHGDKVLNVCQHEYLIGCSVIGTIIPNELGNFDMVNLIPVTSTWELACDYVFRKSPNSDHEKKQRRWSALSHANPAFYHPQNTYMLTHIYRAWMYFKIRHSSHFRDHMREQTLHIGNEELCESIQVLRRSSQTIFFRNDYVFENLGIVMPSSYRRMTDNSVHTSIKVGGSFTNETLNSNCENCWSSDMSAGLMSAMRGLYGECAMNKPGMIHGGYGERSNDQEASPSDEVELRKPTPKGGKEKPGSKGSESVMSKGKEEYERAPSRHSSMSRSESASSSRSDSSSSSSQSVPRKALISRIESLKEEREENRKELQQLDKKIEKRNTELESRKGKIEKQRSEIQRLNDELDSERNAHQSTEAKLDGLEKVHKDMEKKFKELERKLKEAEESSIELKKNVEKLEESQTGGSKQMERQLQRVTEELDAEIKEADKWRQKHRKSNSERNEFEEEVEALRISINSVKRSKLQETEEQKRDVENLRSKNIELDAKLTTAIQSNNLLNLQIQQVAQQQQQQQLSTQQQLNSPVPQQGGNAVNQGGQHHHGGMGGAFQR
jgi:predicted  nucleic acid-binding Zn-ribbon protein